MKPATFALAGFASFALLAAPLYAADKKDSDPPGFNELDKNDDGKLSRAEAAGNPNLARKFSQTDSDGDGYLTRAEYLKTAAAEDWHKLRENAAELIKPDDKASRGSSK